MRGEYGTEFVKVSAGRLAMFVLLFLAFVSEPVVSRDLDSMEFPRHKATSDVGDIIEEYPDYLRFALTIGRSENPALAKQIEERFARLRNADEKSAARFLKGLRYEMVQKLELSGLSPKRANTENPMLRRWVAKYMPLWLREVDEYQFRAFAAAIARR